MASRPPNYTKAQQDIKETEIKDLVLNKLKKVRGQRYIAPGHVVALICFFEVPKGDCDIRMVYNGSESGLNECMWVPRFILPTVHTHLRGVGPDTYMSDVDLGEFLLNFILHPTIRPHTGVDFTKYFPNERGTAVWEPWQRAAMGLRSSPYQAVQAMAMAEEFIRGDRKDPNNMFRWDSVQFNLPGSDDYDPSMPWVYKVRLSDGKIAVDVFGFVDDFRQTGNSQKKAWLAGRQVASRSNHLGIQDAPRKRRDGSSTPGAWTGSIIRTGEDGVFLLVSVEKWEKTKAMLEEMLTMIESNPDKIPRKRLEQIRGFLNYVAQTYTWLRLYLIRLHMTIDGWRPNRDLEGWRLQPKMILVNAEPNCPTFVAAVPRLAGDIEAMKELCSCEKPPLQRVRCRKIDNVLKFEYGQWTTEAGETNSSNWRELNNLVEALERIFKTHDLGRCEFFMFTDNSTAEAAYWKGTSKSRKLFELVLRLKKLEVKYDIILHVIHVSGKRMIAQGTDGLSRGDHSQGVMQGLPMTAFIPLHIDPFERSPKLKRFVEDMCGNLKPKFLSPTEWFTEEHKVGTFVWSPPPAAAEVVVEQLGFARLKRPQSPTSTGSTHCWIDFEGLCCKKTCRSFLHTNEGIFCANFLSKRGPFAPCKGAWCGRSYTPRGDKPFPVQADYDKDGDIILEPGRKTKFLEGRKGDHLMVPFQCDECHFRNITGRNPTSWKASDSEMLEFTRRANLDAFWDRSRNTVSSNLSDAWRMENMGKRLGMRPMAPPMGPFPLKDIMGMRFAIAILDRSLGVGQNEEFVQ
eukprot:scaffold33445_cov54-Attheya_sp.AAC.2